MRNSRKKKDIDVLLRRNSFQRKRHKNFGDCGHKLKIYWQGISEGTNVGAIAINGRLIENVLEFSRVNEQIMHLKIVLEDTVCNVSSA